MRPITAVAPISTVLLTLKEQHHRATDRDECSHPVANCDFSQRHRGAKNGADGGGISALSPHRPGPALHQVGSPRKSPVACSVIGLNVRKAE